MRYNGIYKAEKGLIKVALEVEGTTISNAMLTGDFFLFPEEYLTKLEGLLLGRKFEHNDVRSVVEQFYQSGITSPAVTVDDFISAIMGAKIE